MDCDPCTISDVAWLPLVLVAVGAAVVAAYLRAAVSTWGKPARAGLSLAVGLAAGFAVGLLDGGSLGALLVAGAAGACAPWVPGTLRTVVKRRTGAE